MIRRYETQKPCAKKNANDVFYNSIFFLWTNVLMGWLELCAARGLSLKACTLVFDSLCYK